MMPTSSRAEYYRRRGLEAQQQAARTTEEKIRDAFEDVAEGWFELAELMCNIKQNRATSKGDKRPLPETRDVAAGGCR